MRKTVFTMMLLLAIIFAKAQPGTITNVTATQHTDGSAKVDVYFNLSGPALTYYISMEVSFNDGANYWPISASALTGNLAVNSGTNYHIIWDALQSHPNRFSDQSKIMLVATAAATLNPCPDMPTVTDIDGNVYNTVLIGTQCWMKENLRTTRFRNGFSIQPWLFWYANDISYKYQYGGLYKWHAVNSDHGLCPEGWHVPTRAEWDALVNYSNDGSAYYLKSCRQVGTTMGGEDCNTEEHPRWDQHASVYGIDEHGFSALPGGRWLSSHSQFLSLGQTGNWWTSEHFGSSAYKRDMVYSSDWVGSGTLPQSDNLSVRCIKTID